MDLGEHSRLEFLVAQRGVDLDHSKLNDIGGGALDRHIDGDPFGTGERGSFGLL